MQALGAGILIFLFLFLIVVFVLFNALIDEIRENRKQIVELQHDLMYYRRGMR